jgi:hypothetical protein
VKNVGVLFWLATFALLGLALIARPKETMRWLIKNRNSVESGSAVLVARIIGISFVLGVLAALSMLWR